MIVSAADARTVDELLAFVLDGGQPEYLTFRGHRPPAAGGIALVEVRDQLRLGTSQSASRRA